MSIILSLVPLTTKITILSYNEATVSMYVPNVITVSQMVVVRIKDEYKADLKADWMTK